MLNSIYNHIQKRKKALKLSNFTMLVRSSIVSASLLTAFGLNLKSAFRSQVVIFSHTGHSGGHLTLSSPKKVKNILTILGLHHKIFFNLYLRNNYSFMTQSKELQLLFCGKQLRMTNNSPSLSSERDVTIHHVSIIRLLLSRDIRFYTRIGAKLSS